MYFSGYSGNFKPKIKSKNSTTPNTKINQNLSKIRKLHRTPMNTLNKSQNISITKKTFEVDIKKLRNDKPIHLNPKKIFPIQNIKNIKSINLINKSKNLKIHPLLYNNINNNKRNSKGNSLSNYFSKTINKINHNMKRNRSNTNIINITNANTTNFNEYIKNNYFYNTKSNINNLKKHSIIKIKDYLNTEELSLSKNIIKNTSIYPLVITEESKKNFNENNPKFNLKNENSFITSIKNNYPSIKQMKTNSSKYLTKSNYILNNNQNNTGINPVIINNQSENLSSEKNSGNAYLETFEYKIINDIKQLKNFKNNEIIDKIKMLFGEAIEYLVPKELQNIFLLLLKEILQINKEYSETINNLKEINEKYKTKIIHYEIKYKDLVNKFKNKEKELNDLKKEIENNKQNFNNLEIKKNTENINNKKKLRINISSIDLKIKNDYNTFIKKLNAKNVDDLDAIYFLDKINYKQNEKEQKIPKLNLDQKYIDDCIKNELIKRNEVKLTPFQKIALQFEIQDA